MTATSTALAKQETGPSAVVGQYIADFALVLPDTFRPETFVRLAQGALRRDPQLREAAENNPGSLLVALLDAARLGHEPGTSDYYLTPRKRKNRSTGRRELEVLGIEGYRGIVKRMLNNPVVLAVKCEAVYDGDTFDYVPGEHDRPIHRADWFGDRGQLIGAYAYAVLQGDTTSRVAVVGPTEIARAKAASEGANSEYSPWKNDPDAMYRKTALRRLEPWVAKSTEYVAAQADRTVAAEQIAESRDLPELPPVGVDMDTGEVLEGELIDVEDPPAEPEGWAK